MFRIIEQDGASKQAFVDANIFIENHALFLNDHPPMVSIANDGELNFYWKTQNVTLDLGFYGNTMYSYYLLIEKEEYLADNISVNQRIDDLIIKKIKDNLEKVNSKN